jgi:16S rRNA (cytosine967-C5)-methyltransferase
MDIGSQSIVPLLELAPGLSFLDVCAAPGNKTAQALESGVRATACDVHLSRLRSLGELDCGRVVLDATMALPFRERFDRILVDAPCSGTGTLGRNPEIKWRIHPELPAQMHAIQCAILRNAMDRLASGGVLVYSTCSLEAEENEAVIEGVLGRPPERVFRRLPGRDAGDGFFAAVIRSK